MTGRRDGEYSRLPEQIMVLIDRLCNRFEHEWRSGRPLRIEVLLKELETKYRRAGLAELLPLEIEYRGRAGQPIRLDELIRRFPTVQKEWLQKQLETPLDPTTVAAVSEAAAETIPNVLGDYRILSRLGGGGMGAVYRAIHERMGREVALKVLRPEIQNNVALQQRFDREVRAAAKLSHSNIVAALDARQHGGLHFLVTELVEGSDLDQYVRQHGPLTVSQAVDVILQAAAGLGYAHAQGIIHRDIKPANLLMSRDGVVKILDMGLARFETESSRPSGDGLTDTGVVMGTAAYMAPEQARDTRSADARSDLYSLGCTLHFLLTGRPVYSGVSPVDTILAHMNEPVPSLRQSNLSVPLSLDHVFQSLVAKAPAERIQTAEDLQQRLQKIREQGLDGSDSAELRDLVAMMAVAPEGNRKAPLAPTEFQVTVATDKPVTRRDPFGRTTIPRLLRRAIPAAFGVFVLLGVTLFWRPFSGHNSDTIGPDPGTNQVTHTEPIAPDVSPPRQKTVEPKESESSKGNDSVHVANPGSTNDQPQGWSFDGTSQYLAAPTILPESSADYTIEVIARARRYKTSNLISWLGPNWMAIYISEDGHIGSARQMPQYSDVRISDMILPTDNWTHIAVTFSGSRMTLFVDGRPAEQQNVNFELSQTTGGLHVGGVNPLLLSQDQNQRFFAGDIRAVRVSTGLRYQAEFAAPNALPVDSSTLVILDADEEGAPVFVDHRQTPVETQNVSTP